LSQRPLHCDYAHNWLFDKLARATRHATKLQRFRDEYIARQSFAQRIGGSSTPGRFKTSGDFADSLAVFCGTLNA